MKSGHRFASPAPAREEEDHPEVIYTYTTLRELCERRRERARAYRKAWRKAEEVEAYLALDGHVYKRGGKQKHVGSTNVVTDSRSRC